MQPAPAVSYPVGAPREARRVVAVVCAAGAAVLLAWALSGAAPVAAWWAAALGWLGGTAVCWRALRRSTCGQLGWNGCQWHLSAHAPLPVGSAPQPVLDLQRWMLLEWPGPTRRWLWLSEGAQPGLWPDLRRAVFARPPAAGTAAPTAGGHGAAGAT